MDKPLNIRQQRFAEFVVSGMSATQAYIKAGYKVSEKVAGVNATRTLGIASVAAYVAKLRATDTGRAVLTKEEKRDMIAKRARGKVTVSDLVKLLAEDSKLAGHYEAERIEVETGPITLDTVKEIASRVRDQSPLLLSKMQDAGKPGRPRHATPIATEAGAAPRFRPLSRRP